MRNKRYWLLTIIWFFLCLTGIYFILVNTTFKDKVLPNISLSGEDISFASNAEIADLIGQKYLTTLPSDLQIRYQGQTINVPVSSLGVKADYSQIINYGKGNNILRVIQQGMALIGGKDLEPELTFNVAPVLTDLSFSSVSAGGATLAAQTGLTELPQTGSAEPQNSSDPVYFDGTVLHNCSGNNYQLTFDQVKLKTDIKTALQSDSILEFDLNRYLTDPTQFDVVSYCKTYQENIQKLSSLFQETADWNNILDYQIASANKTGLEIKDQSRLLDFLNKQKTELDVAPVDGSYVDSGGKLYMYKSYTEGKSLNINASLDNFTAWLKDPATVSTILSFDVIKPPSLLTGKEVVNVTKLLASGKSRLDIIRDGRHNYRVENAQVALVHLNNTIVAPGQEVSFYKISGMEYDGVPAGLGVCNASTTFFRAALEAGFPITERHPHTSQIWSYEYPFYPLNIVEATFFAGPVVDTKFVNDLQYPVLLHVVIDREEATNWQYHTIEVYTSPQAPDRQVELHDFTKTNIRSESHFTGSFIRTVKDNGQQVREDKWISVYYN
jgi:vancomycin resistance protein YoaR